MELKAEKFAVFFLTFLTIEKKGRGQKFESKTLNNSSDL